MDPASTNLRSVSRAGQLVEEDFRHRRPGLKNENEDVGFLVAEQNTNIAAAPRPNTATFSEKRADRPWTGPPPNLRSNEGRQGILSRALGHRAEELPRRESITADAKRWARLRTTTPPGKFRARGLARLSGSSTGGRSKVRIVSGLCSRPALAWPRHLRHMRRGCRPGLLSAGAAGISECQGGTLDRGLPVRANGRGDQLTRPQCDAFVSGIYRQQ